MSRFGDAMNTVGNEALLYAAGDTLEYWPGGDEAETIDVTAIFTPMGTREEPVNGYAHRASRAEIQLWADATNGVAAPDIKLDCVIRDGATWRITEIIETVGGMHRLLAEKQDRGVVGRARGMRN